MNRILILLTIILLTINVYARLQGQKKIDSLESALKKLEATDRELGVKIPTFRDTAKVSTLIIMAGEKVKLGNYSEARNDADEALMISEKIGFKRD